MRGKLHGEQWAGMEDRITPADAGKTYCIAFNSVDLPGSPPRMRGKRFLGEDFAHGNGITPADAGKTFRPARLR